MYVLYCIVLYCIVMTKAVFLKFSLECLHHIKHGCKKSVQFTTNSELLIDC